MKMDYKQIIAIGISIALFLGVALYFINEEGKRSAEVEIKIVEVEKEVEVIPQDLKVWRCRDVVTCKRVDWRYYEPEDVCEYEFNERVYSVDNPVELEAYGGWCEEITP